MSPRQLLTSRICIPLLIIAGVVLLHVPVSGQKVVVTVAGTGVAGLSGDDGPAIQAQMGNPVGLCFDGAGHLYIAESSMQCIRKVDAVTGIISRVAGKLGISGFSGDGGDGTQALLDQPMQLCIDGSNHLYFVDYNNHRVRMIDLATGIIRTVAGNGGVNYMDGGVAVNGGLTPVGIAVDGSGVVYISQPEMDAATPTHLLISRLDPATGIIRTVAGSGQPGAVWTGEPPGLAIDANGILYAPGGVYGGVSRIAPTTGVITDVPLNFAMQRPLSVALEDAGHLVVADMAGTRIMRIDLQSGAADVLAGNGGTGTGQDCAAPTATSVRSIVGLAFNVAGDLYFSELYDDRIRKITASSARPPLKLRVSGNPACARQPVTFTVEGPPLTGSTYRWTLNGDVTGDNSDEYIGRGLSDGDVVGCRLTITGNSCSSADTSVTVRVVPILPMSISISTPVKALCRMNTAEFTAFVTNAGDNPHYQWMLNDQPVGGNSDTYDATGLADNDQVKCMLTVDGTTACATVPQIASAPIIMRYVDAPLPGVAVQASTRAICPGDPVAFSAAADNAGAGFGLQWTINGKKIGVSGDRYETTLLENGDVVGCVLTPGTGACMAGEPVNANGVTMAVHALPEIRMPFSDTTVLPGTQVRLAAAVQGNIASWRWTPADALTDAVAQMPVTLPMKQNTDFRLTVVSTDGCAAADGLSVKVYYKLALPGSFTPNGDGRNDVFRIPPFVTMELDMFAIYDRWGNTVFRTKDIGKGWDGTRNGKVCVAGVYAYFVKGRSIRGEINESGTVVLVR